MANSKSPLPWVQVGFTREGRLLALDLDLYCNAGNSLDLRWVQLWAACSWGREVEA